VSEDAPKSPPPVPPVVEPVQVDSQRVAIVGLVLFTVAAIVLAPFYGWLGDHGHRIWLWTCVAGIGVGLFGFVISHRHKRRGRTR
jgi:MFS family permease